ncbi:MAG TPA: hypothetical protein VGK99_19695 [Acidobacteriota bacterium]|jgi:hypothetical protein
MHILLTCATPTEAKPLRKLLSSVAVAQRLGKSWIWERGNNRFELLRTGISPRATAEALRQWNRPTSGFSDRPGSGSRHDSDGLQRQDHDPGGRPDAVLVFGLAGSLQGSIRTGSVIIPQEWRSESQAETLSCCPRLLRSAKRALGEDPAVSIGGAAVTVDRPALSAAERVRVHRKFPGALICDMETYVVMQRFRSRSLAIRIVSDDCVDKERIDFKRYSSILARYVFQFLPALSEDR